jgi:hypothetical protein
MSSPVALKKVADANEKSDVAKETDLVAGHITTWLSCFMVNFGIVPLKLTALARKFLSFSP